MLLCDRACCIDCTGYRRIVINSLFLAVPEAPEVTANREAGFFQPFPPRIAKQKPMHFTNSLDGLAFQLRGLVPNVNSCMH